MDRRAACQCRNIVSSFQHRNYAPITAQGGNLATEKKYKNYELHIEWRFKRTAGKGYTATLVDGDGVIQAQSAKIPGIDEAFLRAIEEQF